MNAPEKERSTSDYFFEQHRHFYELKKSYFWTASHCDAIMKFALPLVRRAQTAKQPVILDAGCGFGNLVERLRPYGTIVGLDPSLHACTFCRDTYAIRTSQGMIENAPFSGNLFDVIFAIDVIEHIKDDLGALNELYRILKPRGYLIATVPAFMCLWGHHDKEFGHLRRYSVPGFARKAIQAGFTVRKISYFKSLFFLPLLIMRSVKKAVGRESIDFYEAPPWLNELLRRCLDMEIPLLSAAHVPFGTSILSVLYKE